VILESARVSSRRKRGWGVGGAQEQEEEALDVEAPPLVIARAQSPPQQESFELPVDYSAGAPVLPGLPPPSSRGGFRHGRVVS